MHETDSNYSTKLPTFHWGCLASTVRQIDIWGEKKTKRWFKFDSFMAYAETKQHTDLWKQVWINFKNYSDKLKNTNVFLNWPGELLVQVVWFWGVEFDSHMKAVWWANWKTEQNRSSEHVRMCHKIYAKEVSRPNTSYVRMAEARDFVNLLLTCFLMLFVTSSQCWNGTNVMKTISTDVEKLVRSD